jgi:hypothetical protein
VELWPVRELEEPELEALVQHGVEEMVVEGDQLAVLDDQDQLAGHVTPPRLAGAAGSR